MATTDERSTTSDPSRQQQTTTMSAASGRSNHHQDVLVRRGKDLYAKNKLAEALDSFKQAAIICTCNKVLLISCKKLGLPLNEIPLPVCHCKDFVSLATNGHDDNRLAMYAFARKDCTCGSGVVPCRLASHIDALNGMAAVCEALKDYDKAYQYASLLVIIAPHAPEGYLRVAKALRLKDPHNRFSTKSGCLWIYQQAKNSVLTHGDPEHEKLKALGNLTRRDILKYLPPELQQMVLQQLSLHDLCGAMSVSKAWNHACRNKGLWRHLQFVRRWHSMQARKFPPGVLNDIVSKRSQNLATSLTVNGLRDFSLDHTKLRSILKALPKLQVLSLCGFDTRTSLWRPDLCRTKTFPFKTTFEVVLTEAPASLEVLRLGAFHHGEPDMSDLVLPTIRFAKNLRELSFVNLSVPVLAINVLQAVAWPKLEKLTIKGNRELLDLARPQISFERLLQVTPALKELVVDEVEAPWRGSQVGWKSLERCTVGRCQDGLFAASRVLRSVDLSVKGYQMFFTLCDIPKQDVKDDKGPRKLGRLEHFCCLTDSFRPKPSWMPDGIDFSAIQPSCESGTLRSLHISFSVETQLELDKFLDKQAIETLSCHDILMPSILDGGGHRGHVAEFLEWVDEFPNLSTIGVFPQKTENAWMTVGKVLRRRPDIKTLYTDALHGVHRDEVLEYAAKNDVTIIHASRVPEPDLLPLPASEQEG